MEDLLKQILIEVRNLSYLFFAFGVIWGLLFLYLYSLSRRERDLERELDEIKRTRSGQRDDEESG
jgi:CcmD family protein